jgi:hypothetical protein
MNNRKIANKSLRLITIPPRSKAADKLVVTLFPFIILNSPTAATAEQL